MIEDMSTSLSDSIIDEKDKIILELTKELHDTKLLHLAEQEVIKQSAKNVKAVIALLELDFTLTEDEFLESVIAQIQALKNDETTAFLFSTEQTDFVGVEPMRNYDSQIETNSLKELVKNYFSK